jgi:hypothetical protein
MTRIITTDGRWLPGQSGNPRGRPPGGQPLTELLRLRGEKLVMVGSEEMSAREALAESVWQFVNTGQVRLGRRTLKADSASEWADVVKWLYNYVEPPRRRTIEHEAEVTVRVVREGKRGT